LPFLPWHQYPQRHLIMNIGYDNGEGQNHTSENEFKKVENLYKNTMMREITG